MQGKLRSVRELLESFVLWGRKNYTLLVKGNPVLFLMVLGETPATVKAAGGESTFLEISWYKRLFGQNGAKKKMLRKEQEKKEFCICKKENNFTNYNCILEGISCQKAKEKSVITMIKTELGRGEGTASVKINVTSTGKCIHFL